MTKRDKKEQYQSDKVEWIEIEEAIESSDNIRVGNTVFSMRKLRELFSKKKIGDLYKKILQNSEVDNAGALKFLPQ